MSSRLPAPRKLVLAYVDSLRTDMLEQTIAAGRAPNFARLKDRGVFIPDCVSSFPSVTPVACAEMVTGARAESHWISGMNWYHRLERRYVEYGSSLEASRAFGIFRSLYDLVYNMNLAHLNPELETVFETLDDRDLRTACTPFLIYRGRHRHAVSLEGLVRRAIDATGLKLSHHTWGPRELFYGDLYSSRPVPCKSSSIPGNRDDYSACCAAELATANRYDFLLLSLPDNDNYSHRHGPQASIESIAKADACFGRLIAAAGGLDGFLADHALVLVGDHAHSAVDHELQLIETLSERWPVLGPSQEADGEAVLAVGPSGRAAHIYALASERAPSAEAIGATLTEIEGIDLVCGLEDDQGHHLQFSASQRGGLSARAAAEAPIPGVWAKVAGERGSLSFRPLAEGERATESEVRDLKGRSWELRGDLETVAAEVQSGVLTSQDYPDPMARVWSALLGPNAGDWIVSAENGYECVDWGGSSHVGGGSHGSLLAEDSLVPLLFVGCGPDSAEEKRQWGLHDVVPVIHDFFSTPA